MKTASQKGGGCPVRRSHVLVFLMVAASIVIVDAILGDTAEFLNAWWLLVALFEPISGSPPGGSFIMGQEQLGIWAPFIAGVVWAGISAFVSVIIIYAWKRIGAYQKEKM